MRVKTWTINICLGLSAYVITAGLLSFGPSAKARTSHEPPALIYYANESSEHFRNGTNIHRLLDWLKALEMRTASDALRAIELDVDRFSSAVEREIAAIQRAAPLQLGVAVLTNASVLGGHYLVKAPGEEAFSRVKIEPALSSGDVRFESNPLNDAHILRALMSDAVSRVVRNGNSVVLVIKSHGNEALALMPRTFADTTRTNLQEIGEYLARYGSSAPTQSPEWLTPVGVSKGELMSALNQIAVSHRIRFGVVFLEACEGGVGLYGITHSPNDKNKRPFTPWQLPPTVDHFVSSGAELMQYSNLNYDLLLRRAAELEDLQSVFIMEAQKAGLTVQRHSDYFLGLVRRYLYVMWFAPLVCWLFVIAMLVAWRRGYAKRTDGNETLSAAS